MRRCGSFKCATPLKLNSIRPSSRRRMAVTAELYITPASRMMWPLDTPSGGATPIAMVEAGTAGDARHGQDVDVLEDGRIGAAADDVRHGMGALVQGG